MPSTNFNRWPQWQGFQTFVESDEMERVTLQEFIGNEMARTPGMFAPMIGCNMGRDSISFFGSLKQKNVMAYFYTPGDYDQRASLIRVKIVGQTNGVPGVFQPEVLCLWAGWYHWSAFKC